MRWSFVLILLSLLLVACSQSGTAQTERQSPTSAAVPTSAAMVDGPQPVTTLPESVTVGELAERLRSDTPPLLLDVREPFETEIATIPGKSILIPVGQLEHRLNELDPSQEMVVYCQTGARSQQAVRLLRAAGFAKAQNLTGGILGWAREIDPSMPTY